MRRGDSWTRHVWLRGGDEGKITPGEDEVTSPRSSVVDTVLVRGGRWGSVVV